MKNSIRNSVILFGVWILLSASSFAQTVFSRFDFFDVPLETATIGPNGLSVDADATTDGGAFINANCGATKGIDLEIPNPGNLFDKTSLGMGFGFRRMETRADFFVRGGTSFYVDAGFLRIQFRTSDGAGGFVDYGPYNTGFALPSDLAYHEYIFVYQEALGTAFVAVDGLNVWTFDGPDGRPLYWTGAANALVGTVMDGNCPGMGVLDYAYFFEPSNVLDANLNAFEAIARDQSSMLNWELANTAATEKVQVNRSTDGNTFLPIVEIATQNGQSAYAFEDITPGKGTFYYQLALKDAQGNVTFSETRVINFSENEAITAFPNPCKDRVQLQNLSTEGETEIRVLDLQGKEIKHFAATETANQIDVSGLGAGMYFLQIKTAEGLQSIRIVKD